jgi:hypothetical protein
LGPFLVPLALVIWLVVWVRRRRQRPALPQGSPPGPSAGDES